MKRQIFANGRTVIGKILYKIFSNWVLTLSRVIPYHCWWFLFILLNCKFFNCAQARTKSIQFPKCFQCFFFLLFFQLFEIFVWVSLQQEVRNARKFSESCNDSTCYCLNNRSVLLPMGELCSIGSGF